MLSSSHVVSIALSIVVLTLPSVEQSHFTGGFAGGQAEYVRVPL
jgi:hypothetical protein